MESKKCALQVVFFVHTHNLKDTAIEACDFGDFQPLRIISFLCNTEMGKHFLCR